MANKLTLKDKISTVIKQMFTVKSADELISASKHSELKKTLNDEDCLSFLYGLFKTIGEISLKDNTICFIANNADIFSAINLALSKLGLMEGEIEIEDENFKNSNKYKIVIDKNSSKFLLQNFIVIKQMLIYYFGGEIGIRTLGTR